MKPAKSAQLRDAAERVRLAGLAKRRASRAVSAAVVRLDDAREVQRLAIGEDNDARAELVRVAAS